MAETDLRKCTCRWTFRLGQPIRFPDPKCPVHAAAPTTRYISIHPWSLDGVDQPAFSTAVEAESIEQAQVLAHEQFATHVKEATDAP